MTPLTPLKRDFLNRFHGDFPLVDRPFARGAELLGTDEANLIDLVRGLLDDGELTRFGPLCDAERLGGRFTLAALAVPTADFERVTAILNAMPEVAHNYRREHPLNMWFVLAAASERGLCESLMRIQSATGMPVYEFPKLKEFHLGFWIELGADGSVGLRRLERAPVAEGATFDALDRAILAATPAGLPVVPEAYAAVGERVGASGEEVIARLAGMLRSGAVRRIGAVPNHYRLGLRGNGMSMWDVPDEEAEALGVQVGALDFVSHCYLRPRRPPVWPYNLFAMVHGRDRAEAGGKAALIAELLGAACPRQAVRYSTQVLKKAGLRWAA